MYKPGYFVDSAKVSMPATASLLVLCTCPDKACAEHIAYAMVDAHLAACVNIIPDLHSIYRWQGVCEQATETLLLLKTTEDQYAGLEQALRHQHPYETPEIIALPIVQGFSDYLQWVRASTQTKEED